MISKTNRPQFDFLQGGGEMGEIISGKNWRNSPLGVPEGWPQALKFAMSTMLHNAFANFIFWGEDYICLYNDAYRPSLGNNGKHPSILGQRGKDAWSEIWDTIHPLLENVRKTGKPTWSEDQLIPIYRNGRIEEVYWTFSYSPLFDEDGKIAGILVTCMETTEAVKSLQKLAESQNQLKFAIDAAELGTWDYDPINNKLKSNRRLKEWFGLPPDESISLEQATGAIIEIDRTRVNTAIQEATDPKSSGKYDISYTIQNKDSGEERYVRAVGRAWVNEEKVCYRFNGTLQNNTEQRKADKERLNAIVRIQEEKERFRNLVKNAPIGIATFKGKEHRFEMVNQRGMRLFGRDEQEVVGKPIFDLLPEGNSHMKSLMDDIFKTGKTIRQLEFPGVVEINKKPQTFYFNVVFHPLKDDSEKTTGIMIVADDVTESVKLKHILQENEKQFRKLIMESPIPMAIYRGEDLVIELVNQKMLDVFLHKKENDIIGKRLVETFPEQKDQKYIDLLLSVLKTGKPVSDAESYALVKGDDGMKEFYIDFHYEPLLDIGSSTNGIMVTVNDVTEKVKAREKLEEFSKELEIKVKKRTQMLAFANKKLQISVNELEATNADLESFAYVSSHDLQEPLRKIQMFTSRIATRDRENLSESGQRDFDKITTAAKRMRELIEDLLAFSRANTTTAEFEKKDLKEILHHVLENLSEKIEATETQVETDNLLLAHVIPFQIRQVFQNLIENAIKFSREGISPKISITSEETKFKKGSGLKLDPTKKYAHIIIKDNGIGFDPQFAERIFDVFQRLHGKLEFEGTGVGLAIVRKIMQNHNGAITASSREGEGATFEIWLPL